MLIMNNAFAAVVIFMAGVGRSPGRASALHNSANDGGGGRHDGAETGMTASGRGGYGLGLAGGGYVTGGEPQTTASIRLDPASIWGNRPPGGDYSLPEGHEGGGGRRDKFENGITVHGHGDKTLSKNKKVLSIGNTGEATVDQTIHAVAHDDEATIPLDDVMSDEYRKLVANKNNHGLTSLSDSPHAVGHPNISISKPTNNMPAKTVVDIAAHNDESAVLNSIFKHTGNDTDEAAPAKITALNNGTMIPLDEDDKVDSATNKRRLQPSTPKKKYPISRQLAHIPENSYTYFGVGACQDSSGSDYQGMVKTFSGVGIIAKCSAHCLEYRSPTQVGFFIFSNGGSTQNCNCLFEYGTLPAYAGYSYTVYSGSGEIVQSDQDTKRSCYKYNGFGNTGWDIMFLNLTADFSFDSVDELVMEYEIAKDRDFETILFAGDCETNISGIVINQTAPASARISKDVIHDSLKFGYSLDKSMITGSNIWNATSAVNQIELCQVVRLIIPADGDVKKMVITEDNRKFTIDFDLSADFEIANSTLGAATINSGAGSANVTSYVEACKCDGTDFTCDNEDALIPNSELFVCIKSNSPDVEIESLQSMIVTQGETTTMDVIDENRIQFPSITTRTYVPSINGVVVSTFVPSNIFDYSTGAKIDISGSVVMKFVEAGGSRKLVATTSAKSDENKDSFKLEVVLQREMVSEEDVLFNSATFVATKVFVVLIGMVSALAAYTMW